MLFLLGGGIVFLWFWLERVKEEGGYPDYLVAFMWIVSLIFCLWVGNLIIYRIIRKFISWESAFNLRFFLQLMCTVIFSLGCINMTYFAIKNNYTQLPPDRDQMILLNIYGTLFLIPVLSIQFGLVFLNKWKKATISQEKLKKEQVQSELTALKSHLSPHFLFNNLNILSSLIQPTNIKAQDYLDQFSEVFRYVLKNRKTELIPLTEELHFIESYKFLLHRRFPDGLKIEVEIPSVYLHYMVPPLSLQVLVENALKHNILSESNPLMIHIYVNPLDLPVLIVENNLQIRNISIEEKTGFGLENIQRRYWLIAQRDIEIIETADTFRVMLPLLLT